MAAKRDWLPILVGAALSAIPSSLGATIAAARSAGRTEAELAAVHAEVRELSESVRALGALAERVAKVEAVQTAALVGGGQR